MRRARHTVQEGLHPRLQTPPTKQLRRGATQHSPPRLASSLINDVASLPIIQHDLFRTSASAAYIQNKPDAKGRRRGLKRTCVGAYRVASGPQGPSTITHGLCGDTRSPRGRWESTWESKRTCSALPGPQIQVHRPSGFAWRNAESRGHKHGTKGRILPRAGPPSPERSRPQQRCLPGRGRLCALLLEPRPGPESGSPPGLPEQPPREFSVSTTHPAHCLVRGFSRGNGLQLGGGKGGQKILSGSQAIVVCGGDDQARTVFLFCFSHFFFLFKASDPPTTTNPPYTHSYLVAEEKLEGRQRQSRANYGDRGHREETASGDHLEKETTLIFRQNQ